MTENPSDPWFPMSVHPVALGAWDDDGEWGDESPWQDENPWTEVSGDG
jgi:hypothetical protein